MSNRDRAPEASTPLTTARAPARTWVLVGALARMSGAVVSFLSLEFLLTKCRIPNGGGVVALRATGSALVLFMLALGLRNALDPCRSWTFSLHELLTQTQAALHWYGAILGATYAAFYTRFASQWAYLAGVYNQIKATECQNSTSDEPLADWKAGFIEDAEELHLEAKPLFASVIFAWGQDDSVRACFTSNGPSRSAFFERLMIRAGSACKKSAQRM